MPRRRPARFSSRTRANVSRSLTTAFSESIRATMSPMSSGLPRPPENSEASSCTPLRMPGQRIAHFMRDDRRHLAERGERRLLAQPLLLPLALRDVVADGHVLPRLAVLVEKRHDRRVHPVERAVLGAVAQLAAPDLALRDRPPQAPA